MALCRLVFTVLLISVSCYANHVPVFQFGDIGSPSIRANPLETTSNEDFAEILASERDKSILTVVFIEPNLSTEDLLSKNGDKTTYPFLEANLGSSRYFPSVDSPLLAIESIAGPEEVDRIDLIDDLPETESTNKKYLFIDFKDAKEDEARTEMLSRHNDIMAEVFKKLQKKGKVVGVYTGRYPSWVVTESHSRQRRDTRASNETDDYILDSVRLFVELLQLRDGDNIMNLTGVPTSSSSGNSTSRIMNTTVTFGDQSFVMNFRIEMGYWFFDSVVLPQGSDEDRRLYPAEELFAIEGFSYNCGQKTTFTNVNGSRALIFNDLQIQPFFTPINESIPFGDAFDCVGFFSGPIWAGLLVTFIILAITFYGIMMMMDIKTMDRFDDPKGKTITINTSE